jgi:hypothetical protein
MRYFHQYERNKEKTNYIKNMKLEVVCNCYEIWRSWLGFFYVQQGYGTITTLEGALHKKNLEITSSTWLVNETLEGYLYCSLHNIYLHLGSCINFTTIAYIRLIFKFSILMAFSTYIFFK